MNQFGGFTKIGKNMKKWQTKNSKSDIFRQNLQIMEFIGDEHTEWDESSIVEFRLKFGCSV